MDRPPLSSFDKRQQKPPLESFAKPQQEEKLNLGILGNVIDNPVTRFLAPETVKSLTTKSGPQPSDTMQRGESGDQGAFAFLQQRFKENLDKNLAAGGEIASYFLPVGKGAKGMALAGAAMGGLRGATQEAEDMGERVENTVMDATLGGVLGWGMGVGGKVLGSIKKTAGPIVSKIFKATTKQLQNLKRYHGLDFADEVIKRDLNNIAGKSGEEMLDYYNGKVNEYITRIADHLDYQAPKVPKVEIKSIVTDAIGTRKKRVLQEAAIKTLERINTQLKTMPKILGGLEVNQIKQDIQTAAKSFYTRSGRPTATSEALAEVGHHVLQTIENYYPGVKKLNSSLAFYEIAQESLDKAILNASKSTFWGNLINPASTASLLYGAARGNPTMAAIGAAAPAVNTLANAPQVRSRVAQIAQTQLPNNRITQLAKWILNKGLIGSITK